MITIALDTTCMTGGVAVLDGEKLVAEYMLSVKRTHSERLMSSLSTVMKDAALEPSDIGLIACAVGPGSFTGIRIGVSSAKAIAMAQGLLIAPVIGLDALCYGLPEGELAFAMIDARHENCYCASYIGTGGMPQRVKEPSVMTVDEVIGEIRSSGRRHHLRGDGVLAYGTKLAAELGSLAALPSGEDAVIRPSKVAMCGIKAYEAGLAVPAAELMPYYIKHSGAEVKAEGKCPNC